MIIFFMMTHKLIVYFMFMFWGVLLHAQNITVSMNNQTLDILKESTIYIDNKNQSIERIVGNNLFKPNSLSYLNNGIKKDALWIKFTIENTNTIKLNKLLVIQNPQLIYVELYQKVQNTNNKISVLPINLKRETLTPSFNLLFEAHSTSTYYLKIQSHTALKLGLNLYDTKSYIKSDIKKQLVNVLFLGVIFTLMIYTLVLFLYVKDSGYFYYGVYLFFLLSLELSYVGLAPLYYPNFIVEFDNGFLLEKISLMMIFYSLYTINFLKLEEIRYLYRIMQLFIIIAFIELIIMNISYDTHLKINMISAVLLIIFTFYAASVSYKKGYKQARLFLLGFSVVAIAYILLLIDGLGIISIVHYMQNILIIATAIESMILSIAFVEKYNFLKVEKEKSEYLLLEESLIREKIVQNEVTKKTDQLNHAITIQDMLFNELHHRVKNNLQLILSITKLQKEQIKDIKSKENFEALENRINAIATTHNTIYLSKDLEIISMEEYIIKLISGLRAGDLLNDISFQYDINLNLPLKKAVYIGLIINELVSNALKHAFTKEGIISVCLQKGYLEISDNGVGYNINTDTKGSLGLKLISILVKDQLKGTIDTDTTNGTKFIIRF